MSVFRPCILISAHKLMLGKACFGGRVAALVVDGESKGRIIEPQQFKSFLCTITLISQRFLLSHHSFYILKSYRWSIWPRFSFVHSFWQVSSQRNLPITCPAFILLVCWLHWTLWFDFFLFGLFKWPFFIVEILSHALMAQKRLSLHFCPSLFNRSLELILLQWMMDIVIVLTVATS